MKHTWTCVKVTIVISGFEPASAPAPSVPAWQGRSIGTTKLRLVEFSAFLEQQRDPDSVSVPRGMWLVGSACVCLFLHPVVYPLWTPLSLTSV